MRSVCLCHIAGRQSAPRGSDALGQHGHGHTGVRRAVVGETQHGSAGPVAKGQRREHSLQGHVLFDSWHGHLHAHHFVPRPVLRSHVA